MLALSRTPADAYRRVELDARIEASGGRELAVICLEEAIAALGTGLAALERAPGKVPREALLRAHGIALWLAHSADPAHPLHASLVQFYGAVAARIGRNLAHPRRGELAGVRADLADVLAAARAG